MLSNAAEGRTVDDGVGTGRTAYALSIVVPTLNEVDNVRPLLDRLATALENARLLEDSLRRANKERAIGEITAKISASVNMRNVLQTAVEELGRAIPGSDVLIQFQADTEI